MLLFVSIVWFLLFLKSSFVVWRYEDIYLIKLRPIKNYVDKEIGKKNINRFLAITGVLEQYLSL